LWRGGRVAGNAVEAPPPPVPTFAGDLSIAGLSRSEWTRRRLARTAAYSSLPADAIDRIRARHPALADATVAAADRVIRHEFDLLGSGPFVPRDPDRPVRDGYAPIDWYLDPVRGLRFPTGIPHKQWNLLQMRPANADVKYPWELGRCQHWAPLGQAYHLTGDDRYAREIAAQLDDFVEANPTGLGVNWTCTMDVGLRAANWVIALELAHPSRAIDEAFWSRAYEALFDHGVFIRNNLENTYEVTSNHFLSNLLGLFFAAAVFADLPQGVEWNAFARAAIEREREVQVLADGADYESSVPYHRLVTELFLGAARLADVHGSPMPAAYGARVADMIDYLAAVVRPDGLMPQVGDADDGRLHIFGGYATTSPQDPRHLFGPAGVMFGNPAWLALGGEAGLWEAAWWGLAPDSLGDVNPHGAAGRLFPNAGIAVGRSMRGDYLLVTNGIVGTNGFGNHKHNDQLSFEYHRGGAPLIVDPGSYVYTSDGAARNQFRATAYHSTLSIDGVEQNDLRPDWLLRMIETSHAETMGFDDEAETVRYAGRHHGYERIADPVTHERTFELSKSSGDLRIVDRLAGRGRHEVRWHFHFAPGVATRLEPAGAVSIERGGSRWRLVVPAGLELVVREEWYSPSYGVRQRCLAVDATATVAIEGERAWEFVFTS
jgi:hypothetical protein